jgi:hypothetical protein
MALLAALLVASGPAPAGACAGDCDADGTVSVAELINGVGIFLGNAAVSRCPACDRDRSGSVTVDELVAAVAFAINGLPPGTICTVAGTGQAQYDGEGRLAGDISLYFPIDIEFQPDGRPLIMDWNNLLLRRLEPTGILSTVMGIPFVETFPINDVLAKDTSLHHASDVEFDADEQLYLAGDHVPVVFRVENDDRVQIVAGKEEFGNGGDGGPALDATMTKPYGVLPDGDGGLYISDVDSNVVRYVDPDGTIHTVAGTGEQGYAGDGGLATEAKIAGPSRLRLGPDGSVYFCETKSHVVRRLLPDGTIDTFAGTGVRGYSGDGGAAGAAQLNAPYDIRFAPNGDAYIADTNNNAIRRVDAGGVNTTVAGTGEPGFGGDGGPVAQAVLRRPSSLTFDGNGSMWIADTSNHRVRRVWRFLDTVESEIHH